MTTSKPKRGRPPKRGAPPKGWKNGNAHPGVFVEAYSLAEVAQALLKHSGILSRAAEELECSRPTLQGYLERHPDLRKIADEAVELTIDLAETKLIEKIKRGNLGAIIFYLKTKGKHRGYVERQQVQQLPSRVSVYLPQADPRDLPPGRRPAELEATPAPVLDVALPDDAAEVNPVKLDRDTAADD